MFALLMSILGCCIFIYFQADLCCIYILTIRTRWTHFHNQWHVCFTPLKRVCCIQSLCYPYFLQGIPQEDAKLAAGVFNMFQNGCVRQFLRLQCNNGLLQKMLTDIHIPPSMSSAVHLPIWAYLVPNVPDLLVLCHILSIQLLLYLNQPDQHSISYFFWSMPLNWWHVLTVDNTKSFPGPVTSASEHGFQLTAKEIERIQTGDDAAEICQIGLSSTKRLSKEISQTKGRWQAPEDWGDYTKVWFPSSPFSLFSSQPISVVLLPLCSTHQIKSQLLFSWSVFLS